MFYVKYKKKLFKMKQVKTKRPCSSKQIHIISLFCSVIFIAQLKNTKIFIQFQQKILPGFLYSKKEEKKTCHSICSFLFKKNFFLNLLYFLKQEKENKTHTCFNLKKKQIFFYHFNYLFWYQQTGFHFPFIFPKIFGFPYHLNFF